MFAFFFSMRDSNRKASPARLPLDSWYFHWKQSIQNPDFLEKLGFSAIGMGVWFQAALVGPTPFEKFW